MKSATAFGIACLVASAAMNQFAEAADSGWYGGLSIGLSEANIDGARVGAELLGSGLTMTSIDEDDTDVGFKGFVGFKLNRNFALEGGYFNLGEFGYTATTTPAGTATGNIKISGFNLDAVGILPLSERFSAIGRIGVQYAEAKDSFSGTGAVPVTEPNPSKRAANYKAGVGVQYDFTETLGVRAEWERYRINDAVGNRGDVDMLSVGLVFIFGGSKSATVERSESFVPPAEVREPVEATSPPPTAAPEPVVVAAIATPVPEPKPYEAPPPLLVMASAPALTQTYCSILDIQFEINRDAIQREEKERLGVVGTFLKKYPDTTAVIEGHTDEVGAAEANMKLSLRRAQSVVTYLAANFGIARSRLEAVGYGETRPIADNRTEEGKRLNRRIGAVIACATDMAGLKPLPGRVTMAMDMEFDANKADVRPQYREELRKVADFLKTHPTVTATVEGHTGNLQATPKLAMEISQRRAQNVVNYLVDNFGIARSRLAAEGFGQTRRFAYNTTKEGQKENRRINVVLNYRYPQS